MANEDRAEKVNPNFYKEQFNNKIDPNGLFKI